MLRAHHPRPALTGRGLRMQLGMSSKTNPMHLCRRALLAVLALMMLSDFSGLSDLDRAT
jgi:hypothetical protein